MSYPSDWAMDDQKKIADQAKRIAELETALHLLVESCTGAEPHFERMAPTQDALDRARKVLK